MSGMDDENRFTKSSHGLILSLSKCSTYKDRLFSVRKNHFIIYLFYRHFFCNKVFLHVSDLTPILLYFVCFVYRNKRKITKHVSIANQLSTNFPDIAFDLLNGTYKPYRKLNDEALYKEQHSRHPPPMIRELPISVNKRINSL